MVLNTAGKISEIALVSMNSAVCVLRVRIAKTNAPAKAGAVE